MHGFSYKSGSLHCEEVDLSSLAATYGTPLYVYSGGTITVIGGLHEYKARR